MMRHKVTMICREIWRAETIVDTGVENVSQEQIKDIAWAEFDSKREKDLEQENYTKVERV